MRLNVNPTRMDLLKLKKRLLLARRGHELLRNKQDELMRYFIALINRIKGLRAGLEGELLAAEASFVNACSVMAPQHIYGSTAYSGIKAELGVRHEPLMNLRVPKYSLSMQGEVLSYGMVDTSMELDRALEKYHAVLPRLVELAEKERTLEMLAVEIESTRRRVNALEHILIPNLLDTIGYITMKLEEIERGNITRLMKVKDMVRAR